MTASARSALLGLLVALVLPVGTTGCRLLGGAPTPPPPETVTVLWTGAVTDTSARIHARVPTDSARVQVAVTAADDWADPTIYEGTRSATHPQVLQVPLRGLTPDTDYRYALTIGGRIDTARSGRFRTFADGPFSFRVALGACAETGSRHPVFGAIRRANPDLFLHLGDMHYEDITARRPEPFRRAYHSVHGSPTQAALYRSTALAYVWDDHDYGPNNSSRRAPGQSVAQRAYREYVPHYPLGRRDEAAPIYQAFTVGRVRFLLTDLRSARTPNRAPDSTKTMMGARQKQWFKRELRRARDRYPVVAWVSTVPWIGPEGSSEDHWGGFARERRELATYIDSIGVADQLVVLSGDAHMVALDDGTHNHYGRAGGGGFPVVHAAALDQTGSVKGGPYTHGPYPTPLTLFGRRPGQFVLMDVRDEGGDQVCVRWTGKRYLPGPDRLTTLLEWRTCFPVPPS
ncbi:MAG: alkaline phosphatase D family protein [Salinivenus sp.]